MNEVVLFNEIKQGNKKSFDALFRLYYKRLCSYCWKFVRSKDTAEDIVQKVFVQLWMKRNYLVINESVSGYLFTSVKNESFIYLKSFEIRKQYEAKSSADKVLENDGDEKIAEKFSTVVRQKIADLPEKCREIFTMARIEGLTYDEIATYLDVSKKTVENQMIIAYKKLREWLKHDLEKIISQT